MYGSLAEPWVGLNGRCQSLSSLKFPISLFLVPVGSVLSVIGLTIGTPTSTYIYRCGNGCDIRNTTQTVNGTEGKPRFFMDYHAHSVDTANVIKNGFGRESRILGHCIYTMDAINIELPKEPGLENIGPARHHLQHGYPSIWIHKTAAEEECKEKIEEMKRVYLQVENRIRTTIEKDIGTIENRLVEKNASFMPQSVDFQSFYYDNLIPQIFQEIISRSEGNPPKDLTFDHMNPHVRDENGQEVFAVLSILLIGGMRIAGGKDNDIKALEERIRKLLYEDSDLRSLVLKVNSSKNELDINGTNDTYFNEIDSLYKDIIQEGAGIKGKCKLCPPKGWINYF
jgi:hypothetical protein